eukprot:1158780-Pelagomonas_calceolata.AAC.13
MMRENLEGVPDHSAPNTCRTHQDVSRVPVQLLHLICATSRHYKWYGLAPVKPGCTQFLRSVNAPVAAIAAAKRLALDAHSSGALGGDPKKLESARLAVCAQVSLIAARLGKDVQVRLGARCC